MTPMTTRPRTLPDLEARALAMLTPPNTALVAEMLGVTLMRIVKGVPTLVRAAGEGD